ncbi:MAG: NAD(P)H-hydrate dehydratase, partial [Burkholderiaceae bacterium]|nr:NAD(P)H-hydrate dehydratase [Burkholderiaceae bacterium]
GNAFIVGGNVGMVGAALLAARAALRIGAGRVYVDCVGAAEFRVDPLQPELMFTSAAPADRMQALCIGCGLGDDPRALNALQKSLQQSAAVVIDADALNLIASDAALSAQLSARTATTLLTPHPLEAARLLRCSVEEIQADRINAAQRLAERFGSIVILKGAGTVMVHPDGRCAINPTGGPALATAGTGDVLAGLIGGLLAQGFDPWQSALGGAWLHGRAADSAGFDVGLVASEIAPLAARALGQLRSGNAARAAQ